MNQNISSNPEMTKRPKAEHKAVDSESIFRLLVDAVEDYAIFALDQNGLILTWNLGGKRLKGYTSEEVIGTHFSRFYTDADKERDHPAHELQMAVENGKYEEEGWRVRKNGTTFWANVVITALWDELGELRGFGKVTRDLTDRKIAENRLKESEERFRLMVSNVTDYAIIMLDPEGHVTSWNAGAARIKGYLPSDIIGRHFSNFYPKSEIANGKPEMELRIATDEGRYEEEGWRVRKDGTMFWANVTITALRSDSQTEGGRVLRGFAKVTRDLTSRRQSEEALRQSEEKYRLLVDNITDYALILLDPKGRVTSWNIGAERITGYSRKEILGAHFSRFYSKAHLTDGRPENELKVAAETGRFEEEAIRVRKDGTEYWANVVLTTIKDDFGTIRGFSKVTRDLSERKKAEDELLSAYAGLEKSVEQRTLELSEAKASAERAVKARDQFFSIASHELKTPLSSLKMQAQLRKRSVLKGDFSDFAPDRLIELCDDDERQISRLVFLVDNMMDISKLTSGNFVICLEPVELNELIEDVMNRMEPILREAGNTCVLNASKKIIGNFDPYRLEQVLTNLLSNAAKYAPGSPIEIELEGKMDLATIKVTDHGPGISKDNQKRVFLPFERANDGLGGSGLGLGLYILKEIVEAHNGTISIHSEPPRGSTFTVELPTNLSVKRELHS